MAIKTIEIKAQVEDLNKIKAELQTLKATYKGSDKQLDIYFKSKTGHLKLRESQNKAALIYYDRQKIKGPSKSPALPHKWELRPHFRRIGWVGRRTIRLVIAYVIRVFARPCGYPPIRVHSWPQRGRPAVGRGGGSPAPCWKKPATQ